MASCCHFLPWAGTLKRWDISNKENEFWHFGYLDRKIYKLIEVARVRKGEFKTYKVRFNGGTLLSLTSLQLLSMANILFPRVGVPGIQTQGLRIPRVEGVGKDRDRKTVMYRVNRFGEKSPLWPNVIYLKRLLKVHLVLGQNFESTWAKL